MVKCLPAMLETWVRSLGQEDALEKEMATHSSTLAWKIPWTEEPINKSLAIPNIHIDIENKLIVSKEERRV